MKTRTLRQAFKLGILSFAGISYVLFSTVACQKKCQQKSTTSFKSVTETQWRLVQTNDTSITVDNYNFVIYQFASNGSGLINRVVSNEQYENPISTLLWTSGNKGKSMRIQYTSAPEVDPNNPAAQTAVQQGDLGTFDYSVNLGKELELTGTNNGSSYYYRFVPFTGVVAPDIDCTF